MAVSESKPNQRHSVDAGRQFLFAFGCHWPGPTDAGRSAMRCSLAGFFQPGGLAESSRGRSGAQTPGGQSVGSAHPRGMPEFCEPSGVGGRLLDRRSGGVAALRPPATVWQALSLPGRRWQAEPSASGKAGFAWLFVLGLWPGLPEPDRSPVMRAERAKLKSQRDDMIIAPGKQSAARGYGGKMISSFFSF